ncbi:MAG: hypothetical protein H7227_04705 [Actinobacteria bacterium]|nr:hypothetical protein [Actinomycetota bacterium]
MRPTPYVASLRIYEPLSAFEPADQLRWAPIQPTDNTNQLEQELALQRIIFPESPVLRPDGAHVLEIDGQKFVSPWSTAARCWNALEDFKNSLPSSVSTFFLPHSLEEVIVSGIDIAETKVPHILTETWMVPPRWFSLFIPEERVRGRNDQGAFTVMRTSLSLAKLRCESAHQVVREAFGFGSVEEEIEELGSWLELFHPQSYLELDYGGLADYLEKSLIQRGEDGLEADTSIEDVLSSISGLAASDALLAGRGYERLVTRWRAVAAYEQAI